MALKVLIRKFHLFIQKEPFHQPPRKHYSCKTPVKELTCPTKSCNKKKSFWGRIFGFFKKDKVAAETDDGESSIRCCRIKFYDENREDPDLSKFGGQAYRTCGTAYVVQKDLISQNIDEGDSKESTIIKKMEVHPSLKDLVDDSIPNFKNVSQRLIYLSDRKLHPLYDKLRNTPKPCTTGKNLDNKCPVYKNYDGPISAQDIPVNIKFNKELLEKKNMYSEIKRVDPPVQLLGRLIEMKRNERPTMEKLVIENTYLKDKSTQQKSIKCKRNEVFDTLVQKAET